MFIVATPTKENVYLLFYEYQRSLVQYFLGSQRSQVFPCVFDYSMTVRGKKF